MTELESIELTIKEIAIEVLDIEVTPDELDSESTFFLEKFGLNSVDALELLLHVERKFDIEVEDDDLSADLFMTVRSLASYVLTQKQ